MSKCQAFFIGLFSCISDALDFLGVFRILRCIQAEKVIVLMYHGVTAKNNPITNFDHKHVDKGKFEKHLIYLKKHYNIISLQDFLEWKKKKKLIHKTSVMLTFDDGYKNCHTQLLPILKKQNIPATIFLPTKYIGKGVAWYDAAAYMISETTKEIIKIKDRTYYIRNSKEKRATLVILKKEFYKNPKNKEIILKEIKEQTEITPQKCNYEDLTFMSWNDCREMQFAGVTFGSHSVFHEMMTNLSENEVEKEIKYSKETIEKNLNNKCTVFSYPFGKNNIIIRKSLEKQNYSLGFTTTYGKNTSCTNNYKIKRIGLNNLYNIKIFKLTLFVNFPVFHHWVLHNFSRLRRIF